MKALIRGEEVIKEPFSDWVKNNLDFLTGNEVDVDGNPLKGDGWTLVENYIPPEEDGDGHVPVDVPLTLEEYDKLVDDIIVEEEEEEKPVERDYVEINGVRYYRE